MRLLNNFIKAAQRGHQVDVRSISGGSWGGYGPGRTIYGAPDGLDYNREAGLRYDNGIVYTILSFLITALNGVPVIVCKKDSTGKLIPIPDHPIELLLRTPNPWHGGSLLTAAQAMLEGSRGNSYTYKHRHPRTGALIYLEFLPEGTCLPYTWPGNGEWISEYRINTASGMWRVPPADVLHMRWETVFPSWPQLGMSPLEAYLPDIVADKQAAMHEASVLRNAGVTTISASPKPPPGFTGQTLLGQAQRDQLRDDVESRITGGNKGRPLIWSMPVEVTQIGLSPKDLDVKGVRDISEQRICSGFNVHPAVLGLGTGLRETKNRASIEGAIDITMKLGVLPYMRHRGEQLTADLIPELGQPGEVVMYDLSKIDALRELILQQVVIATGGPVLTPNEGRAEIGEDPVEGGDTLRGSSMSEQPTDRPKPMPRDANHPPDRESTGGDQSEDDSEDDGGPE